MTGFTRVRGTLVCDEVALDAIAREVGTPCHVYSAALLTSRFAALEQAMASVPHRLHYALKANSTLAIVRHLRQLGAAADVNSAGELEVALRAGFTPDQIVVTGVGKTRAELARAVSLGVAAINAESFGEIDRIEAAAIAAGRDARIAVRINPDVEAGTHRHISTGASTTKFGVSLDEARVMIREVARRPRLRIVGLHVHVGSQITTSVEPLARGAAIVADLARELMAGGVALEHLDLGGGLGIPYRAGQPVISPEAYAAAILPAVRETGLVILLEPGRWIVGPCGVLLTEVVDTKTRDAGTTFVIVDAGMTDLIRPALYEAWHEIEPVVSRDGAAVPVDVVGPVCETSDTFASARALPPVVVGDLLAIRDTGAYGAVMASNYNRRPLAAEVLVEAGRWRLIRRRQTIDDLLQWES
ncbi:MAG: diaminopimelate decarboxylase [Acidobacteria bacterium SCN 69-37]|nr:MAG: diaminopimelate decarboxylase [Acidobacteria bacterium SCN 69-37]